MIKSPTLNSSPHSTFFELFKRNFSGSKSILILFFILIFSGGENNIKAQGASGIPHLFSVTAATPPAVPTVPAPINFVVPAANIDELTTLITPAGFSFVFGGITYTKIVVSTNGWLALVP